MQKLHKKDKPSQLSKYNVVCQCGHHIASYSKAFHGRIAHNISLNKPALIINNLQNL